MGPCHGLTCSKRYGAPCDAFPAFRSDKVWIEGRRRSGPARSNACCTAARCGSPLCWTVDSWLENGQGDGEIEVKPGGLDNTGQFTRQYEVWVKRREPWMPPLNVPQYVENRPAGMAT